MLGNLLELILNEKEPHLCQFPKCQENHTDSLELQSENAFKTIRFCRRHFKDAIEHYGKEAEDNTHTVRVTTFDVWSAMLDHAVYGLGESIANSLGVKNEDDPRQEEIIKAVGIAMTSLTREHPASNLIFDLLCRLRILGDLELPMMLPSPRVPIHEAMTVGDLKEYLSTLGPQEDEYPIAFCIKELGWLTGLKGAQVQTITAHESKKPLKEENILQTLMFRDHPFKSDERPMRVEDVKKVLREEKEKRESTLI